RSELLREHDALPTRACVVVDLFGVPAHRFVKAHRAFVTYGRDRLHPLAAETTAAFREVLVKEAANALAAEFGMNAHEVDIPGLRGLEDDEAEEEPDETTVLLDDQRVVPE